MAAYVVYQGEVTDPVRGGDVEVLEGEPPAGRTVLVEFPTIQAAMEWYRGDDYAEARRKREGAAKARMYIVDGLAPAGR